MTHTGHFLKRKLSQNKLHITQTNLALSMLQEQAKVHNIQGVPADKQISKILEMTGFRLLSAQNSAHKDSHIYVFNDIIRYDIYAFLIFREAWNSPRVHLSRTALRCHRSFVLL